MKVGKLFLIIIAFLVIGGLFVIGLDVNSNYNFRGKYMIYNVTNLTVVGNVVANAFIGDVDCSNITGAAGNLCTVTAFNDVSINATHTADLVSFDATNNVTHSELWVDVAANSTERLADNSTLTSMIAGLNVNAYDPTNIAFINETQTHTGNNAYSGNLSYSNDLNYGNDTIVYFGDEQTRYIWFNGSNLIIHG